MISMKCRRKYTFCYKSNKYHTKLSRNIIQSYEKNKHTHKKYLKTYEKKQRFALFRKHLLKKPLST